MRPLLIALLLLAAPVLAGCIGDTGAGPGPEAEPEPGEPVEPNQAQATVNPGWPALNEATIRPGTNVVDGACTSNFLFRTPDNTTLLLGTAAHCVSDHAIGDPVDIGGGLAEGTLYYSSWNAMAGTDEAIEDDVPDEDQNDLALIALPDEARDHVHPAMFSFGGPTGIAGAQNPGDRVLAHGNSTLRPDALDPTAPREGAVTATDGWVTQVYFAGPGIPGDSGSPVLTADGQALGDLIELVLAPTTGANNVANLAMTLAFANEHLDTPVELVTWPMIERGPVPGNPLAWAPSPTAAMAAPGLAPGPTAGPPVTG